MSCSEIAERLDDYVDGELSGAALHDLELHLAGCAACQSEERALRNLLALAVALPKSVRPARDLWPGVAGEIRASGPGRLRYVWPGLAAAAALVIGFATLRPTSSPTDSPSPSLSPVTIADFPATAGLGGVEAHYERATAALLSALQERPDDLDPETLVRVRENLAVIDAALNELREALGKEPGNLELTRMLAATHRKKVDVLQRVVKLSTSKL